MFQTRRGEAILAVRQESRPLKGRGALSNNSGRYEDWTREPCDDGWPSAYSSQAPPTTLSADTSRTVVSFNASPDVPFDRSLNPYRGCEHGCVYCYARPTHAWLGLSPGLDFETKLFVKPRSPEQLQRELGRANYHCAPLTLGAVTDAYQPIERSQKITRRVLEVLAANTHPVSVVTKSALVERDIDILSSMAARRLASVAVSLTTLDRGLAARMEPRAPAPQRRLATIQRLCDADIPTGILVAPVIPALTDHELERILERAAAAGATWARYAVLRLPLEVQDLFFEWAQTHVPDRAAQVRNRLHDFHRGRAYDSRFGQRMRGTGVYADLLTKRFALACQRLRLREEQALDTSQFRPVRDALQPTSTPTQLTLL